MDVKTMSILGAALAVGLGAIGPGLGEGLAVAACMNAIARQHAGIGCSAEMPPG